jgi:hypothetical protein
MFKKKIHLDTVVEPCKPSYWGGRNQENCASRAAQAKISKTPISTNKLDLRTSSLGQKHEPLPEK